MKITKIKVQGCCGGVLKAIDMALQTKQRNPDTSITILGNLVHNAYVKEALAYHGLKTIEDSTLTRYELLDQINEGIVIFTAHGISDQVRHKAMQKGLTIVDASCPFVLQTQKIVHDKLEQGYSIFYIGKYKHPEAEAIYLHNQNVYLIQNTEDIPKGLDTKVFVTNQTTMSILEIQNIFEAIQREYPDALFHDEICNATRVRQQAILDLKGTDVDGLIVVGDPSSNNSAKLARIGEQAGIPTILRIASVKDLDIEQIQNCHHVAITSGASTPKILMEQVVDYLKNPGQKPEIDLENIL